jgi:transposase
VRTWAPQGQTPELEFSFAWRRVSAIAGLTPKNFYFRLHRGAILATQVVAFLRQLRRQLPGRRLLILWDRAQIHRSRAVAEYLSSTQGAVAVSYLPAYCPELNPVECLWGYWKRTELANFCAKDIWHLNHFASQALKRIRRRTDRTSLITAFFHQAELF